MAKVTPIWPKSKFMMMLTSIFDAATYAIGPYPRHRSAYASLRHSLSLGFRKFRLFEPLQPTSAGALAQYDF